MTITLKELGLGGLIEKEIRELKPGESVPLTSFGDQFFHGGSHVVEVLSEDCIHASFRSTTVRVQEPAFAENGSINTINVEEGKVICKDDINETSVTDTALGSKIWSLDVGWIPSPQERDMSLERRK